MMFIQCRTPHLRIGEGNFHQNNPVNMERVTTFEKATKRVIGLPGEYPSIHFTMANGGGQWVFKDEETRNLEYAEVVSRVVAYP